MANGYSIDDVEDNSVLRRGIPVAHNIFGTAQTINSANYVYFLALQEIRKLSNPVAMDIYTEELLNLHRGQGMDLFWRDSLTCPTEEEYLEMVDNKTGGLFRLAVKLMQAESSTGRYVSFPIEKRNGKLTLDKIGTASPSSTCSASYSKSATTT
jgi:geranylgeranyl diphosphate synthase, type III